MCLNRRASLLLFSLYVHCFVMMEVVFVFVFVSFLVCLFCLHDSIIVFGHFCVGHPTLSSYSGATRVFLTQCFQHFFPSDPKLWVNLKYVRLQCSLKNRLCYCICAFSVCVFLSVLGFPFVLLVVVVFFWIRICINCSGICCHLKLLCSFISDF